VTEVVEHTEHAPAKPPPTGLRRLLAPGFLRAAWMTPLFFGIGFVIVVGLRSLAGWEPALDWLIIVTVAALITAPIGFLAGIGAFDYWVYYALGYPTRPEDHSGHGARSWKDYFRVNTDHKVIGIQYVVTTIFFFLAGGLKDKYGVSWQIVPRVMYELISDPDQEKSQRAMAAMLQMGKIEIDELEQAAAGA
jgi:hypothetical protein